MKLLDRCRVITHKPGGAPVISFATYVHPTEPILLRRHGWEVEDDLHEDFYELISSDNGRSWSRQGEVPKRSTDHSGDVASTESAAIYLPQRDRLVVVGNRHIQPPREPG
ncbi:MAG: hypothetical protein ACOC93_05815 [Planctomycetota bacterium]